MIVAAGFTSEMREVLSKAKGKTFKSYECAGRYGFDTFPGSFRVNLGRFAIDVTLDYHPLDGEPAGFGEPEMLAISQTQSWRTPLSTAV